MSAGGRIEGQGINVVDVAHILQNVPSTVDLLKNKKNNSSERGSPVVRNIKVDAAKRQSQSKPRAPARVVNKRQSRDIHPDEDYDDTGDTHRKKKLASSSSSFLPGKKDGGFLSSTSADKDIMHEEEEEEEEDINVHGDQRTCRKSRAAHSK